MKDDMAAMIRRWEEAEAAERKKKGEAERAEEALAEHLLAIAGLTYEAEDDYYFDSIHHAESGKTVDNIGGDGFEDKCLIIVYEDWQYHVSRHANKLRVSRSRITPIGPIAFIVGGDGEEV